MASIGISSASADEAAAAPRDTAVGDATPPPIDCVLECIAGFYSQEADAQEAARQLRLTHGLRPSQLALLGPADAVPMRFARVARQWAGDRQSGDASWSDDSWLAAGLGALLAGVAAMAWLALDLGLSAQEQALLLVLAMPAGALSGAALVRLRRRLSQPRRFDASVRQQLAGGCWAVVAHGVPVARQAGAVSLLRDSSLKWCAAAPAMRRL